ncbi:SusC/RagA family TonB-linked outer membrane protein [Arcticibacterium luteifluviistationis]|uniref:TonB-dependent receptor n=1 Tax=Arcticibacterium luteifluviistationis TaxID=1784714 RepID=A0A2Z4GAI5_9BACT|nr:TonB-dependent receptor [Arcticibacterium luteifluviistationis]AWV98279.1 TonB-dependent receptor [Arcticibacterium luteifluviistationis]
MQKKLLRSYLLRGFKTTYLLVMASLVFLIPAESFGQSGTRKVSGKVTSEDGEGVPSTSVLVKGSSRGAVTNIDGNYTIEASSSDILVISSIGFDKEEIKVGNQSIIDVTLRESTNSLDEIVVVGYGSTSKRLLSGAQTNIGESELKKTVNTTLDQALQGRAPNVFVASNSGKPGGAAAVYIRGLSTINGNNQPMYVIDGVQIIPQDGPSQGIGSDGQSNILSSINPDDIASMNVLSGPSAQSIYGSKASNGVIVITTKKGKAGDAKVNFTTMYNFQSLPNQLPMMNLQEYAVYSNAWADEVGYGHNMEFSDPSILGMGTNWQSALFNTAAMKKQQFSMSGGTDKMTYYISTELMNQEGIAPNSGFNRKSFRINLESQARKYLKIGTNLSLSGTEEKLSINEDNVISTAIRQSPNAPVYNPDGTFGGPQDVIPGRYSAKITNPVALAYTNSNEFKRMTAFGTLYGDLTFLKDFTFHAEFNGNYGTDTRAIFRPSYSFGTNDLTQGAVNPISTSERYSGNNYFWSANQRINYSKTLLEKHSVNVIVGHEAQYSFNEQLSGRVTGFTNNALSELSLGDPKTSLSGSRRDDNSQESYFTRLGYVYSDKYIVQGTFRADASSYFGPNNRWGFFPSLSAAWRVSNESFMENVTFINDLKMRFEVGTTGNQYWGKNTYAPLSTAATQSGQGFLAARFPNPDIKWENTTTYNVGFDMNMLNDRVQVVFDAYLRKTTDLITDLPLPAYAGTVGQGSIGAPVVNIGDMENRGFGIALNTTPIRGQKSSDLTWRSDFNISFDRNKLLKLNTDRAIIDRFPWYTRVISRSIVGQPLFQFYGYEADGLIEDYNDLTTAALPTGIHVDYEQAWVGDVKYKNLDNTEYYDAALGENIQVIDDKDRTFIGNPWPKFTFGFSNSLSYKGFELNVFTQGVYGNQVFNQLRFDNSAFRNYIHGAYQEAVTFARPSGTELDETLTLLNPGTSVPRISGTSYGNSGRATDSFVEDGSYIRIKNIQLSYYVPRSVLKKYIPMNGVKITAGVQNAFTFTKYSGYDPEVGTSGGVPGFDNGRYPSSRMYTMSASFDF